MSSRIDSTNCTHEAALARIAELESKLGERDQEIAENRRRLDAILGLVGIDPMNQYDGLKAHYFECIAKKFSEWGMTYSGPTVVDVLNLSYGVETPRSITRIDGNSCPTCGQQRRAPSDQTEEAPKP